MRALPWLWAVAIILVGYLVGTWFVGSAAGVTSHDLRRTPREALEDCAKRMETLDTPQPDLSADPEVREAWNSEQAKMMRVAWEAQGIAERTEALHVVLSTAERAAWLRVKAVMVKHKGIDLMLSELDRSR